LSLLVGSLAKKREIRNPLRSGISRAGWCQLQGFDFLGVRSRVRIRRRVRLAKSNAEPLERRIQQPWQVPAPGPLMSVCGQGNRHGLFYSSQFSFVPSPFSHLRGSPENQTGGGEHLSMSLPVGPPAHRRKHGRPRRSGPTLRPPHLLSGGLNVHGYIW